MSDISSERRPGLLGALASHPFLKGVDDRLLTLLISGANSFQFKNGELLAITGNPANDFLLLQSGQVSIQAVEEGGGRKEIVRVGPGEVVGWSWVVPPYQWQFTCEAVGDVSGIRFNADWLRQRCEEHHELGFVVVRHLLGVVSRRLTATRLEFKGK